MVAVVDAPPVWVAQYIGLPWRKLGRAAFDWRHRRFHPESAGVDCWGLVRLVLKEEFGIEVPEYAGTGLYDTAAERAELGQIISGGRGPWREVTRGHEEPGDGILLRMLGHPIHCGLVAAVGWMLHIEEGIDSCLERYDGLKWARRIEGFYRWSE
jgi:cell wall-associated NlpC family hydrolase